MKKLTALTLLLGLCCSAAFAQTGRYLKPVFNTVTVTPNQNYGVNATVLYFSQLGQAVPEALVMDVYAPASDTETKRPLALVLHTGNFLPFANPANPSQLGFNGACGGTRKDSSIVEICTRLAKMGYVAASVDYRLGWNPLAATDVERRFGIINAAYRGIQDIRTCIRFFKKSIAAAGNPYGVDSTKIAVIGQGTGGYISLNAVSLDSYLKIPTAPGGKFLWDPDGSGPAPIVPMVLEFMNGNINGTNLGVRTNNGLPTGTPIDTFCIPNHTQHTSSFQLGVNLGGALADSSWIDPGQPALISFHVPNDNFAPYGEGIVNVPGTPLQVVQVQGSYLAQKLHQQFGNNNSFVNFGATAHEDLKVNQDHAFSISPAGFKTPYEGLYPFVVPPNPTNPTLPTTTAPWEWTSYVPATGTCNNDAAYGRSYIDTIMRFYAPRACFALGLTSCVNQLVGAGEPLAEHIELTAAPNPASDAITFTASEGREFRSIHVYDRTGRLVRQVNNVNNNTWVLLRDGLAVGNYIVKASFDEGFTTKIVIFE